MNVYPESALMNANDKKRMHVVFSENKRRYEYNNAESFNLNMIHVDGGLFYANSLPVRCDFALEIDFETHRKLCLIELKGHDIAHACEQLLESLKYFMKKYPADKYYCRIVSSGNKKPNIESVQEKTLNSFLLRNGFAKLKKTTNFMCETSSDLI